MKNLMLKLMSYTSGIALMAAVFAAEIPSISCMHQPKEPANLHQVLQKRRNA